MHVRDLLRSQYQLAHRILEQTIDGVEGEALHGRLPGGTAQSIAATYAHAVLDEDVLLSGRVLQAPTLFESGGWAARTGVPLPESVRMTEEWAARVRLDLPAFRDYAAAVYERTDETIAGLSDAQLDAEYETAAGKQSIAQFLGGIPLNHVIGHSGEIAAQKGARGLKGLPF